MQPENLGQSVSLWMATSAAPNRSALLEDAHADVAAALKEAGLDAQHNAEIQPPRIWVNNEPGVTETPPT